jgi:hypothetical protein
VNWGLSVTDEKNENIYDDFLRYCHAELLDVFGDLRSLEWYNVFASCFFIGSIVYLLTQNGASPLLISAVTILFAIHLYIVGRVRQKKKNRIAILISIMEAECRGGDIEKTPNRIKY